MLRTLLLELAKSSRLRRWITSNGTTRRMAQRFVPGEELGPAIEAARACNKAGMTVSLDHLGENVVTREDAERARASYTEALDQIAAEGIDGNVSLKLTHLGLDLGDEFCAEQLRIVTHRAGELGNFVRVDMEGSAYTDRTLRIVKQARAETDAVGTVIQAYLYRSEDDIRELLSIGCRIRLVKGAYKEPARIAFPRKKDVDANYIKLMKILLPSGIYHALATHDPEDDRSRPSASPPSKTSPRINLNFRCSTESARICRAAWCGRDIACACTFRSARIGFRISCAGWRSAPRICFSSPGISCAGQGLPSRRF